MGISKDTVWESGRDETVEVNQRALIDKVLARYSGEFTVFRELLQNSDDAQSKAVEIRFETLEYISRNASDGGGKRAAHHSQSADGASLPDLKTTPVHQWTFKNNGNTFREEDWNRLKKIAEGNPDEGKIGAFGVGFYSLFSVTEEPFVKSGNQWMGFHWKDKKDQLFARKSKIPASDESSDPWTSFTMPLREPAPIPVAFDFTRFLASSLTFMGCLNEVCVYFDDIRLVRLNKSRGESQDLGIPEGLKIRSPKEIMIVDSIQSTPLVIKAQVTKWIYTSGTEKKRQSVQEAVKTSGSENKLFSLLTFSSSSNPQKRLMPLPLAKEKIDQLAVGETRVSLSIYSASVRLQLGEKLFSEIQRSTKKNPPAQMKVEFIYTTKGEYDANLEEEAKQPETTGSIFQGLRADIDGMGAARVFIGHSTSQSTGIGGHISARFIPTVERESIDFMDRYVAVWNKELLYITGFLARAVYEIELSTIQKLWTSNTNSSPVDPAEFERITNKALHTLRFFTFYPSTPSSEVSSLMQSAFFDSSTDGKCFPMISNLGVCDIAKIRLPNSTISFLTKLPTLPDSVVTGAPLMVSRLQKLGIIKPINFEDIFRELQSQPLAQDEFVSCLRWWITVSQKESHERFRSIRTRLIDSVKLTYTNENGIRKVIPLSSIKTFINLSTPCKDIPSDSPLPDHLLPMFVSQFFEPGTLSNSFPWTELTITQWLSYICEQGRSLPVEYNLDKSSQWAERVIRLIVPAWFKMPAESKTEIIHLLRLRSCISTSHGMFLPQDAYFPTVNMFSDLPVVKFASGLVIQDRTEKFLLDLGVRKHVEVSLVLDRMIKTKIWTVVDLTRYLTSVRASLTPEELQELRQTAAFPKERHDDSDRTGECMQFMANQLYEPLDVFRTMSLPIIDWDKKKWSRTSGEARFLFTLGLRQQPPLSELIELCAGDDPNVRPVALQYLLDNMDTGYRDYDPSNFRDIKFIPALKGSESCLGTIQEVFSSPWAAGGFLILEPSYQPHAAKMKIQDHPPASELMFLLQERPPQTEDEAKCLFSLLSERVDDFSRSDLDTLSTTAFVPIRYENDPTGPTQQWINPLQCYIAEEECESLYSKLFTFVNFGAAGNTFLSACGTQSQPSVEEVAKMLLSSPRRFYELAQGHDSFLSELRKLAVNVKAITPETLSRMKESPILLGLQRKGKRQAKTPDGCDSRWDTICELRAPKEIAVVDDTHAHQAFGDSLFTAPREDDIEAFYCYLGSKKLTEVVKEEYRTTAVLCNSKPASDLRTLILERLPLFLHERTHGRTGMSFPWFSEDQNFVVKAFEKLSIVRHLAYGNIAISRTQDLFAAVPSQTQSGPVELWIAGNLETDFYEVAKSLNRLFLLCPKANDVLLFMTILSTDLSSLERRGYDVDRILRQQENARLAAQSTRATGEKSDQGVLAKFPPENCEKAPLIRKEPLTSKEQESPSPKYGVKPSVLGKWDNKIKRMKGRVGFNNPSAPLSPTKPTEPRAMPAGLAREPPPSEKQMKNPRTLTSEHLKASDITSGRKTTNIPTSDSPGATPRDTIIKNINMAVSSCKSESKNLPKNRQYMQRVKESLNDGYCDISGKPGNLHPIDRIGSMDVYLSADIQLGAFMEQNRQSLARFEDVLKPLAKIYGLPLTSLHIFYDLQGEIVAFNRGGSIFLNLRYFKEWHDSDVKSAKPQQAYISWYFTIAHEIAHNLVEAHNAEHEFYFSAICERYMMQLTHQLTAPTGGQPSSSSRT